MCSLNCHGEECSFVDAHEFIGSMPDSDSTDSSNSTTQVDNSFNYEQWISSPTSVQERRSDFFKMMGIRLEDKIILGSSRIEERSEIESMPKSPIFEYEFSSSRSSLSSWSDGALDIFERSGSIDTFICMNDDTGNDRNDELNQQEPVVEECVNKTRRSKSWPKSSRLKKRWLRKLRSFSCIMDTQEDDDNLTGSNRTNPVHLSRVKVRCRRKRLKELSALFKGQDIPAHEGSILTMKFSVDGQYLASAGKDEIVRVWQVVETDRSNEVDLPEIDPNCLYLTVNELSELAPMMLGESDNTSKKIKNVSKRTSDSACVIFPPKVFRIMEKPLHEFRGHTGDILDLSWSQNHCILSSSVDKTVRLWGVGRDQCLKVFSHCNYVTCVQFNPVDDNYFISGSIDGKVRIWVVNGCHVVDWIDIKDIVTAVSYRPDAQSGISGSMAGHCHFFSVSDNHFQVEDHVCLNFKKKSPYKRVTGFEFFPQDPSKVLVTCADSKVRVLLGTNVIGKYRGLQKGVKHQSAFFSSDGKHVVSACDDSNVYVWNTTNQDQSPPCQTKTIRSFECFTSDYSSVAIPWSSSKFHTQESNSTSKKDSPSKLPFTSTGLSSLCQEYLESIPPKGSATWATWPEEKLPSSSSSPTTMVSSPLHKSQYKFLKSSYNNFSTSHSHAWSLVIVTAGWDGRIRSFLNYGLPLLL